MPREFPFQFSTIASSWCSSDTGESEFEADRWNFVAKRYKRSETNQQLLPNRSSFFFHDMAEPIYHIKNMKICQKAPTNPAAIPLRLDNVAAYNLDIDVGDKKVSTIITLHQVPR